MPPDDIILWTQAGVTCALAGLVWVVQVVVYPGFHHVGVPTWQRAHAAHSRAMALVVGPPWAVQGLCAGALLVRRPSPLLALVAGLALATVVVTVGVSVPLHGRLAGGYDRALVDRLSRTNWLRTAAWTAGAIIAVVLAARAG